MYRKKRFQRKVFKLIFPFPQQFIFYSLSEKFDCFPEHFAENGIRQDPTEQKQQNGQLARCPDQSDD